MNKIDDLLYDNPELYDAAFPDRGKSSIVRKIVSQYEERKSASLLEIACGNGRDLSTLKEVYPDCCGFDINPNMVEAARRRNPELSISVADMRSAAIGRRFDVVCALGASINFAITQDDLRRTINTYYLHSDPAAVLLVQMLNSADYFGQLLVPQEFSTEYDGIKMKGSVSYEFDRLNQVVHRKRVWVRSDLESTLTDSMSFRIRSPSEISVNLEHQGFTVLDVFETDGGDHYNKSLYIAARRNR